MISRDGAVLWAAILCTAIAFAFDAGKQRALDSIAQNCLPQEGEILVSVHQSRDGLLCVFAPASFTGYRALKQRKAT